MSDIVDRLRNATALTRKDLFPLCADALDEIDHQRALVIALQQQRHTLLNVVTELRAEIARLEACAR